LRAGADINARDEDGRTLLRLAARYNNPVVVQVLLDAGADPGVKDAEEREVLKGHDVYRRLNDGRFWGPVLGAIFLILVCHVSQNTYFLNVYCDIP
jgi:hypothetical protein